MVPFLYLRNEDAQLTAAGIAFDRSQSAQVRNELTEVLCDAQGFGLPVYTNTHILHTYLHLHMFV